MSERALLTADIERESGRILEFYRGLSVLEVQIG
jgi:hypothetical protein